MKREPTEADMPLLADHECEHGYMPDDKNAICNCWVRYDLQCRLDALRCGMAPLPMTEGQAIAQAVRLRISSGMTYAQIANVMHVYHGRHRSDDWWRKMCRARGAAPVYHGDQTTLTPGRD